MWNHGSGKNACLFIFVALPQNCVKIAKMHWDCVWIALMHWDCGIVCRLHTGVPGEYGHLHLQDVKFSAVVNMGTDMYFQRG